VAADVTSDRSCSDKYDPLTHLLCLGKRCQEPFSVLPLPINRLVKKVPDTFFLFLILGGLAVQEF
jgi:hypothetical protein